MKSYLVSLLLLSLSTPLAPAQVRNIHPPYVLKRFERLKMSPELLRWQTIPWMSDLSDGLATAKKENRPALVWGSDDDPLDRC